MKNLSAQILLFLLAATALSGCGFKVGFSDFNGNGPLYSTTSGNPLTPRTDTQSANILKAVCTRVQSCFGSQGATMAGCQSAMAGLDDANVVGLSTTQYPSYQSVISAEQVGAVTASGAGASSCLAAVSNQTCSAISGGYQPGLSNPYSNGASAFPSNCGTVFGSSGEDDDREGD